MPTAPTLTEHHASSCSRWEQSGGCDQLDYHGPGLATASRMGKAALEKMIDETLFELSDPDAPSSLWNDLTEVNLDLTGALEAALEASKDEEEEVLPSLPPSAYEDLLVDRIPIPAVRSLRPIAPPAAVPLARIELVSVLHEPPPIRSKPSRVEPSRAQKHRPLRWAYAVAPWATIIACAWAVRMELVRSLLLT